MTITVERPPLEAACRCSTPPRSGGRLEQSFPDLPPESLDLTGQPYSADEGVLTTLRRL
jgi:hypothetical protein